MSNSLINFEDIVVGRKVGQSPLFLELYKMDLRELSLFVKHEIWDNPLLDMSKVENYDYSQEQVDLIWDGRECLVNGVYLPELVLNPEYAACTEPFFLERRKRVKLLLNILNSREKLLHKVGFYLCKFQEIALQQGLVFLPISSDKVCEELEISKNVFYSLVKNKRVKFREEFRDLRDLLVKGQGKVSLKKLVYRVKNLAESGKNDREIAEVLQGEGIKISRRTVCKYRHQKS